MSAQSEGETLTRYPSADYQDRGIGMIFIANGHFRPWFITTHLVMWEQSQIEGRQNDVRMKQKY